MAFMQSMMNPMRAMGSTAGKPAMGAMGARPTGAQGMMQKNAMNPAQQMRGLGPSGPPQQSFSGMRGPSRQREQMPMQQAAQQAQPMVQAPQMQPAQEMDLGSRDPSQQAMMQQRNQMMGQQAQQMPQMPPMLDQNQWQQKFSGLGPSNRMMQGQMGQEQAGHMGDMQRLMNPYGG